MSVGVGSVVSGHPVRSAVPRFTASRSTGNNAGISTGNVRDIVVGNNAGSGFGVQVLRLRLAERL